MKKHKKKLVIIATHAEENPDMATLPFAIGNAALAMEVEVVVALQTTGVYLALRGYADHVQGAGFAPLTELLDVYFEGGGRLMVCSPCIQARNINPQDLIPQATVTAGATLVDEVLSATNVITY
jgi:predicted peroxiredoxin